MADAVSGGDSSRKPGGLVALLLEFLDVRLVHQLPKVTRLAAPVLWRQAGQLLYSCAGRLEGKVRALLKYCAGPVRNQARQLRFSSLRQRRGGQLPAICLSALPIVRRSTDPAAWPNGRG